MIYDMPANARIVSVLYILAGLLMCLALPATAEIKLAAPGIQIKTLDNGAVEVCDETGKMFMNFGDYHFMSTPTVTDGGTSSLVKLDNGQEAILTDFKTKNDTSGKVRVQSEFTVFPHRVHLRYDIWGPDDLGLDYAMVMRRNGADVGSQKTIKRSLWVRDEKGGIPYEVPDMQCLQYKSLNGYLYLILKNSNPQWQDTFDIHFPAKKTESGHYVAEGDLLLTDAEPAAAAALLKNRPVALDINADKVFNIWDSASTPLGLNAQAINTSDTKQNITLSWWARDFNGKIVTKGSDTRMLDPYAKWDQKLSFNAPKRGILFVEVQASDGRNTDFRRTNLAVLPPHKFNDPNSIFGISAYFALPTESDAENLLSRIGVKWIRNMQMSAKQADSLNMMQNFHSQVPLDDPNMKDEAKRQEYISKTIADIVKGGAHYWEFGNEINMDGGIGNAVRAKQYVSDFLIPAANAIKQSGANLKLTSIGLSGADTVFLDKMHEYGAWDCIDAISLHPGRGNYTADYGGDNWRDNKNCDYWNFLGTIRKVKDTLKKYGDKPIFLTEAYAPTAPHLWWGDTYREAAENVVLEYALALSEGVKIVNWYQLNDTVWYDQGGVDNTNPEFHYGLLNRDLSPKPSLLGYETIAAALENTTFTRWLDFGKSQNKGLLFNSPKGPVTILWNRTDGYILNKSHKKDDKWFATPEPWVDHWKSKILIKLPATGKSIREIDCIGQERLIPVKNGIAQVILDGAPRIYYGVDIKKMGR